MAFKTFFFTLIIANVFGPCNNRRRDCTDAQIPPTFVGYNLADIDTFILRKFVTNNNFNTLLDTFIVKMGDNGYYTSSHDTTNVFISNLNAGIKADFNWQIFIPSKNKTINISEIKSEKKAEKCGRCNCSNTVFSLNQDGQMVNFSSGTPVTFFIKN